MEPAGDTQEGGAQDVPSLPTKVTDVIPEAVLQQPGAFFIMAGAVLLFKHRDKVLPAIKRLVGRGGK